VTDNRRSSCLGLEGQWLETAPDEHTHYHDQGQGIPLTLLHGSGPGVSAAANWWLNLPALARDHRVVALDLLGFGRTQPAPDANYGISAWVDHTLRLLDALGIERTWLVGNSLGGWVSFQAAITHPDRLLGLVSMGTGGAPRPPATPPPPGEQTTSEGIRKRLSSYLVNQALLTDELIEARRSVIGMPGAEERFNAVIATRDYDRVHNSLDQAALARLDLPVLLVHGREDKLIPASWSWHLFNTVPRADLYLMSNCGHWSQVDRSEEFNRLVVDFVDSNELGR
jgi:2-hydroxymuconate-semialdehyde hydrolase